MDFEKNNIITSNNPESHLKTDSIIDLRPDSIKKDILYFKEEVLQDIKQFEKNIIKKNKEANDFINDKIFAYDIKINLLKENINSLSDKIIEEITYKEKLTDLIQTKQVLLDTTDTNRIKISLLEKETRDNINRINDLLKQSIIYPGIIGNKCRYSTFHEFIDFLLSESNANSTFRHKNIMDISSFKIKIDKNVQTLSFKIDTNLTNSYSYTDRKVKEAQDKFEDMIRKYKKNLDDLRIENSDYVIQLEKDTKDLRNELSNIKRMKNEIYNRVDNQVMEMKTDNKNISDELKENKKGFDLIKNDISRIDKKIEELMIEKIGILFDGQKTTNNNLEKFQIKYNENKNDIDSRINEINNHTKEEQAKLVDSIEEINEQLNAIWEKILNTNTIKDNSNNETNSDNNTNNNINKDNEVINDNTGILKEKKSTSYSTMKGKTKFIPNRNIKVRTFNGNNKDNIGHFVSINKMALITSQKKGEIEKAQNLNYFMVPNTNNKLPSSDNYNNILTNKKLLENLKISKIQKMGKLPINKHNSNNNLFKNVVNSNINDKILSEIQNDNMQIIKNKKVQNPSHNPQLLSENILDNNNDLIINSDKCKNINKKKISPVFRNKTALKRRKLEEEKDLDYENYLKFFSLKKNKNIKRRSFDNEKIKALQKFQKLLKIDINDINAKLNNFKNSSDASFKVLNENEEIYDRFFKSNSNNEEKNLFNKNINTVGNHKNHNRNINKINLLNIYSTGNQSEKNTNENHKSTKNLMEAKTSSYFYHLDPNKKLEKDFITSSDNLNQNKLKNNNNIRLIKSPNSETMNIKNEVRSKPLGSNSVSRYHNYFIGFFENDNDNKKKNKKKIKYKSLNNNKFIDEIKDSDINVDINKNRMKQIKGILGIKNK